jgi:hypothetical protein
VPLIVEIINRPLLIYIKLILIYINDLPSYIPQADTVLYADDTTLGLSEAQAVILNSEINSILSKVRDWLLSYIIYQGTDILPEIFSSSPHTRVFVARKNFWRYISAPRYIRKRIARKKFSLGQLYL